MLSFYADKVGPHRMVIAGLIGVVVLSIPQFLVLGTGSVALIYLALLAMRFAMSALYGPVATVLAEGFAARVRYTGISLSYQVSTMVFGGLSPIVAATLAVWAGGSFWPVAGLLMAISLIGVYCTARLKHHEALVASSGRVEI